MSSSVDPMAKGPRSLPPVAQGLLATLGIAAVLGLGGRIAAIARPVVLDAPVGMTMKQQERLEEVASSSLFGQFRSSMADFLWMKVDKYLHSGVDLRGVTESEKRKANADRVSTSDEGFKHSEEETTVVPSRARDWRGVFGDIEREVRPYQDMENHKHKNPKEALPLFRLMTWSNPHFIPGYTNGAAMIAREQAKLPDAIAFLQEGERNNPRSIEIKVALGEMLTAKQQRYEEAFTYLKKALELGLARDRATMTEDEKEAFQNALRWTVLNRRDAGDHQTARRAANAGLRLFPGDVVCTNYLKENK